MRDETSSRGDLDSSGLYEATSLDRAQGDPTFYADETQQAGIANATRPALTFGLLLMDYDLDGRLDLLQANGHVEPDIQKIDPKQHYRQPAQLFWNTGRTGPGQSLFQEVPSEKTGDLPHPIAGRGATYADIDQDGDLDLALTQIGGPPFLLQNEQQSANHWLRLRLQHRSPNVHATGAAIEVTTLTGTRNLTIQLIRHYLSQIESYITLPPPPATTPEGRKAQRLLVTWPDSTKHIPWPSLDHALQVLGRIH